MQVASHRWRFRNSGIKLPGSNLWICGSSWDTAQGHCTITVNMLANRWKIWPSMVFHRLSLHQKKVLLPVWWYFHQVGNHNTLHLSHGTARFIYHDLSWATKVVDIAINSNGQKRADPSSGQCTIKHFHHHQVKPWCPKSIRVSFQSLHSLNVSSTDHQFSEDRAISFFRRPSAYLTQKIYDDKTKPP